MAGIAPSSSSQAAQPEQTPSMFATMANSVKNRETNSLAKAARAGAEGSFEGSGNNILARTRPGSSFGGDSQNA